MSDLHEVQKPEAKQLLSRPQKIILAVLIGVNLLILGAVWFLSTGNGTGSSPPASAADEAVALGSAYEQALAQALRWQADVQVVSAATSWRLAAGDSLTLHRPTWSFSFYSPTVRRVHIVNVDQGRAQAGPVRPVGRAPQPVAPDWSLDSDELLLTFLGHGGEAFLGAHAGANIHLQLQGEGPGRSVWYITAVDPVERASLLVGVDARTRQVVLSKSSEGGA